MTSRKMLLRANALYLLAAAAGGMCTDLAGAFSATVRSPKSCLQPLTPPSASSRRPCLSQELRLAG